MQPAFVKRPRGSGYMRAPDVFWCDADGKLARGRKQARFL